MATADGNGKRRMEGGKANKLGVLQGGVISPLVANLYMNRFLKYWRQSGRGEARRRNVINYADDFSHPQPGLRGRGAGVDGSRDDTSGLGPEPDENLRAQCTPGAVRPPELQLRPALLPRQTGRWFTGASPSKESVQRLKDKVAAILVPGNVGAWEEVRDTLNRLLPGMVWLLPALVHLTTPRIGWSRPTSMITCVTFSPGTPKLPTRGSRHIRMDAVFGTMGVLRPRKCRHTGVLS